MYLHHVVTIALILGSYRFGCLRVGHIVLLLHDACDIPLDLLKMTNYMNLDEKSGTYLVELSFVSTIVGWIYTR